MPGKKNFVSERNADGIKVHQQKRLVLCNLREAYYRFKILHPDVKIGFSKFAQLRPKECVLAGSSGTHSVCVCVLHQNAKLMMAGGRLEALTQGEFKHYSDCLTFMQCEPTTADCTVARQVARALTMQADPRNSRRSAAEQSTECTSTK